MAALEFEQIQTHLKLGRRSQQRAQLSRAAHHYQQVLSLDAAQPQAHQGLAQLYQRWGEIDLASQHYQAAFASSSSLGARFYFDAAMLYAEQHRYGWAAACYRQAIACKPDFLAAYLNLGDVLIRQGATEDAIDLYQQAVHQFPANASLRNNLAQVLHQQERWADALKEYENTLILDPTVPQVQINLGRLWLQHQDPEQALKHYGKAVALQPSAHSWGCVADLEFQRGEIATGLQALQSAVAYLTDGLLDAYCQHAGPTSNPSHLAQARHSCSILLRSLQAGEMETAEQALFQIYTRRAAIAQESEAFHRAETLYQRAIALQPQEIGIYAKLAHCLAQQRRLSAAQAIIELAQSLAESDFSPSFNSIEPTPAPQPSPSIAKNCSVTCSRCMEDLIDSFQPRPIAAGVFQIQPNAGPKFSWPTAKLHHLHNGRVWVTPHRSDWAACHEIVVTTSADQRITQGSREYPWKLPNCSVPNFEADKARFERSQLPPMENLSGTAVLLSTLSGHVFYHWMIDLLPRLAQLQQQGIQFEQIDHFIVNSLEHDFQKETLQFLGVPLERVVESDCHPHLQVEQLIVPDFPGHLDWIPPSTIDFLRSHFLPHSQPQENSGKNPKRIYISRQNARYRRLLNHAEVEVVLASFGFVTVSLEELTVAQQVQLFSNAEVIVSPHGSSLSNLVFCQPGTQVIELFSPRYIRTDYWMVSQSLNLHHHYIVGRSVGCRPLQELMYQSSLTEDIYIELNALRSALRSAHVSRTSPLFS